MDLTRLVIKLVDKLVMVIQKSSPQSRGKRNRKNQLKPFRNVKSNPEIKVQVVWMDVGSKEEQLWVDWRVNPSHPLAKRTNPVISVLFRTVPVPAVAQRITGLGRERVIEFWSLVKWNSTRVRPVEGVWPEGGGGEDR